MEDEFYDCPSDFEGADAYEEFFDTDATLHTYANIDVFPLHRAAFENDAVRIKELMPGMTPDNWLQQDTHGNNALHVAALRCNAEAIEALLQGGISPLKKNSRGWSALDEAVAEKNRPCALLLHRAVMAAARAELKEKRQQLLTTMRQLPDYSMQLKWELGSSLPGLGMLLRHYAPHDCYTIWKVGDRLRVDGSLMGIDTKSESLLPQWKRGHFSLIFDGRPLSQALAKQGWGGGGGAAPGAPQLPSPKLLFINHGKKTWIDLGADKKEMKEEEEAGLEDEVLSALECDVDKVRLKARDVRFRPVRGWLGGNLTERVEGWQCSVYEAAGKVAAVSTGKAALTLPADASFDDYLAASLADDPVTVTMYDPLALGGGADPGAAAATPASRQGPFHLAAWASGQEGGDEDGAAAGAAAESGSDGASRRGAGAGGAFSGSSSERVSGKARVLRARCWMAEGFPMSLSQLLPLLDVIGAANKQLGKVAKFMRKYGDMNMFPVKLQVPLLLTLYALVSFKQFTTLHSSPASGSSGGRWRGSGSGGGAKAQRPDPEFFEVPGAYTRKKLADVLDKHGSKAGSSRQSRHSGGDGDDWCCDDPEMQQLLAEGGSSLGGSAGGSGGGTSKAAVLSGPAAAAAVPRGPCEAETGAVGGTNVGGRVRQQGGSGSDGPGGGWCLVDGSEGGA